MINEYDTSICLEIAENIQTIKLYLQEKATTI